MLDEVDWRLKAAAAVLDSAGVSTAAEFGERVGDVLDERACRAFAQQFGTVAPAPGPCVDELVPSGQRRAWGAYFTPRALADRIAHVAIEPGHRGVVVDLSCGNGALLGAALRRSANVRVVGVEQELVFAAAAAARLVGHDAKIFWGDGLARREEVNLATAVVGNPPYVGEKGHRDLFERVRTDHPDLQRWFGPRIDLHYLFLHRALDVLEPGGQLAYLTSEYWLTATGAGPLRADLRARSDAHTFEQLGAGAFDSAPGQHSLIFGARRRREAQRADDRTWHPFAAIARDEHGIALGELCSDRQGFVSGADRVSARMSTKFGLRAGAPVFLWHADEVPEHDRDLFRPLIRRSDCRPDHVFRRSPARDFVLWCDGSEGDELRGRIEPYLQPYRAVLERRREVKTGSMRWSRIWWPRRVDEYQRPKLVVPRRASAPAFCLDLSGSHVSSDCTFLLAPDDVEDEIAWLARIMVAANSARAEAQLRAYGKTKGEVIEFYSAPLRDWRLPLRRSAHGLELLDEVLETKAERILDASGAPRHIV